MATIFFPHISIKARILQQLSDLEKHPMEGIEVKREAGKSLHTQTMMLKISGEEGSHLEGGVFTAQIVIPTQKPTIKPELCFLTRVYHPQVSDDGTVHLDQTFSDLRSIVRTLKTMLHKPDPGSPAPFCSALQHWQDDPSAALLEARYWAIRYAYHPSYLTLVDLLFASHCLGWDL